MTVLVKDQSELQQPWMQCQREEIRYLQHIIQKPSTKIIDIRDLSLHAVLSVEFLFCCCLSLHFLLLL